MRVRAIEFYSGIGAFRQATSTTNVEVVAAFDQSQAANYVYHHNFGMKPVERNLDSIPSQAIPEAELWWLSPPCTPFSVRGKRRDDADPRAKSFLRLTELIAEHCPTVIMIENVSGFVGSRVHNRLQAVLAECSYEVRELDLCPTLFGVPMRRPRHYVAASRLGLDDLILESARRPEPIAGYLAADPDARLMLDEESVLRYGESFDIVDPNDPDAIATCFTSGYWKCMKASGSFIKEKDGRLRRFSPEEIVALLGFSEGFRFPDDVDLRTRWRLVGNSVDVRAVTHLLKIVRAA